jgi:hypothetical protein
VSNFPNRAGDHPETDGILIEELHAAGIQTMQESVGQPPEYMNSAFRTTSGEVKTSVMGVIGNWTFKRNWYYWVAEGPGIDIDTAMNLWKTIGKEVRANGDCGCRSPHMWNKGMSCGFYHVDTPEGLHQLASTIKRLMEIADHKYKGVE